MIDQNKIDLKEFRRGRIAAALGEPFDANQSLEWCCGYTYEIFNPSGGLTPQKGESNGMDKRASRSH